MYTELQKLNPELTIRNITDPAFRTYGYRVDDIDTRELEAFSLRLFVEKEATRYTPSSAALEALDVRKSIEHKVFGQLPIEIGCCYGTNTRLNGMEYHSSNEMIVAATDIVLMLGRIQDIAEDGTWDSALTELFYVEKGSSLVIYSTTLHLAPCRVSSTPFNALIILPKGTNEPLTGEPEGTLFRNNKWMLAHAEGPAAKNGAAVRTKGVNLEVKTL
ncbi:MAG: DUF4867 family protein [Sphaerochaetaceae bacterium]|nr:DUF4867 family protein [Sphaerochaetaceae bacterium]